MTLLLILSPLKLSWSPAERGVFWLRQCGARKHVKVKWVEWGKVF